MVGIFAATKAFEREYDHLFDFVGACSAAIWNMRWQVRGYRDAHPDASREILAGRFIAGSGIGGFKFEYFTDNDWNHQEAQIARVALVNVIALYERWLEGIPPLALRRPQGRRPEKSRERQICEALPRSGDANFAAAATELASLISPDSGLMGDLYGESLKSLAVYDGPQLASLLTYYRFFKELRNQFMHRSDEPHQLLLDAYAAAANISYTPKRASRGGKVAIPTIAPSQHPDLHLRHAFFACHIVRSLVRTLDIEFSATIAGEADVLAALTAGGPVRIPWKGSESRALGSLRRYVNFQGYPRPVRGNVLYSTLRTRGLLNFYQGSPTSGDMKDTP